MLEAAHLWSRRAYKKIYLDRLWTRISGRVEGLRNGSLHPDQFTVPGSRELLEALRERGLQLYLASGTDDANVKEEAALLDLAKYFDGRVSTALRMICKASRKRY